jgi:hypothetical protein
MSTFPEQTDCAVQLAAGAVFELGLKKLLIAFMIEDPGACVPFVAGSTPLPVLLHTPH